MSVSACNSLIFSAICFTRDIKENTSVFCGPLLHFRCAFVMDANAEVKVLSVSERESMVNDLIEPLASDGLRTLCIAYRDFTFG